jgi:hypothetical protein
MKRDRCMSNKSETSFSDVMMLTFSSTVLLMCMWTKDMMGNPKFLEKRAEVAIFAPSQNVREEFSD